MRQKRPRTPAWPRRRQNTARARTLLQNPRSKPVLQMKSRQHKSNEGHDVGKNINNVYMKDQHGGHPHLFAVQCLCLTFPTLMPSTFIASIVSTCSRSGRRTKVHTSSSRPPLHHERKQGLRKTAYTYRMCTSIHRHPYTYSILVSLAYVYRIHMRECGQSSNGGYIRACMHCMIRT